MVEGVKQWSTIWRVLKCELYVSKDQISDNIGDDNTNVSKRQYSIIIFKSVQFVFLIAHESCDSEEQLLMVTCIKRVLNPY